MDQNSKTDISSPESPVLMHENAVSDDEISLKDIILKVRKWIVYILGSWKIIVLFGLIGGSIGLYRAWTTKPRYKATFSFVLEDEKSGGMGGALGLASQFGLTVGSSGGGAFSGDNLMELMKSRRLVQKALLSPITQNNRTQSLVDYYIDFSQMRDGWSEDPELSKLSYPINANVTSFSRLQDSILMKIHKTLTGDLLSVDKADKKLSIIEVEVKSTDELFAKSFTEALVNEVSRFYVETKTKKSLENVSVLQHQTDSVRRELNKAITGAIAASDGIPNLNMTRQVLRSPSQQRQIDVQANTAILIELVKNLELAKLSLRRETPLIQIIDKPILPLEKERLGKLKSLLVGGFLGGFFIVAFLLGRRFMDDILK